MLINFVTILSSPIVNFHQVNNLNYQCFHLINSWKVFIYVSLGLILSSMALDQMDQHGLMF